MRTRLWDRFLKCGAHRLLLARNKLTIIELMEHDKFKRNHFFVLVLQTCFSYASYNRTKAESKSSATSASHVAACEDNKNARQAEFV